MQLEELINKYSKEYDEDLQDKIFKIIEEKDLYFTREHKMLDALVCYHSATRIKNNKIRESSLKRYYRLKELRELSD